GCKHKEGADASSERIERQHEPGYAITDREQQLPEKTAYAAARSKPEEQMPDSADEQEPADDNRNTYPGGERQSDSQKPADQHQDSPNHIALPRSGCRD